MSASLRRLNTGSVSSFSARARSASTIFPANFPFQSAKSFSLPMGTTMIDPRNTPCVGRSPGHGNALKLERPRRQHAHVGRLDPPAASEVEPFGPHILEPPALQLVLGPSLRAAHRRRVGQPAADLVEQVLGGFWDFAVIHPWSTMDSMTARSAEAFCALSLSAPPQPPATSHKAPPQSSLSFGSYPSCYNPCRPVLDFAPSPWLYKAQRPHRREPIGDRLQVGVVPSGR